MKQLLLILLSIGVFTLCYAQTDSTSRKDQLQDMLNRGMITQQEYEEMTAPKVASVKGKKGSQKRDSDASIETDGHHFGARAGINISFSNNTSLRGTSKRPKPGATVLFFHQYHKKKFVLMNELAFEQKGSLDVINDNNNAGGPTPGNQRTAVIFTVNYLQLVVLAGYRTSGWNFYGGISNGFNLKAITWLRNTGIGNNNPSNRVEVPLATN